MGWSFGWDTRKSIIEHCTREERSVVGPEHYKYIKDLDGNQVTVPDGEVTCHWTTVKSQFKGTPYQGNLWCVKEVTYSIGGVPFNTIRFIALYLLKCSRYGGVPEWGYKDMDETCGPYEVNCPLSYLAMTPAPKGQYAVEWRRRVYEAVPYSPKMGENLELRYKRPTEGVVINLRPLMVASPEGNFKIQRKYIIGPKAITGTDNTDNTDNKE